MASKKKSVFITGCKPGGIGHALAEEFHSRGFRVFATARELSTLSDLEKSGIECFGLTVDDPTSVTTCHKEVREALDGAGLDFLINNAGKAFFSPAVETDLTQAKRLLDTNLLGIIDINQTFFPELLKAKGTIVNMGSAATHLPMPMNAVYCASKAGLYAYSEVMRVEVAPLGVKVQFVQIGGVKTDNILKDRNHLIEDSLWNPVSDAFERRQEIAANGGVEPAAFAKKFAGKLLAGHKNVLWVGEGALVVKFIHQLERWLPFQLWPFLWSQDYKMSRISAQ